MLSCALWRRRLPWAFYRVLAAALFKRALASVPIPSLIIAACSDIAYGVA